MGKTDRKIEKSDEEWRAQLSPEEFHITREHGTERAFTGPYWDSKQDGIYHCVCCGEPLFDARTKYNSGTGWPSFWQPLSPDVVEEEADFSWGVRTEIRCAKCDAHLGHKFDDGPNPTGSRYCMNGTALKLEPR